MTTQVRCPGCRHFFEPGAASGLLQCPKCSVAFMAMAPEGQQADELELQVSDGDDECNPPLVPLAAAENVRPAPAGQSDDDDGLLLSLDDTDGEADFKTAEAQRQLKAAQQDLANSQKSWSQEDLIEQVTGNSPSSSRHFKTVFVGIGVMFGGLIALARAASHIANGRTSELFVIVLLCVVGLGICIFAYGVIRGIIEMIGGLYRGKRRK